MHNKSLLRVKVQVYKITDITKQDVSGHPYYLGALSIKDDYPTGTVLAAIPTGLYSDGYASLPVESVGLTDGVLTCASEIGGYRVIQVTWLYIG